MRKSRAKTTQAEACATYLQLQIHQDSSLRGAISGAGG